MRYHASFIEGVWVFEVLKHHYDILCECFSQSNLCFATFFKLYEASWSYVSNRHLQRIKCRLFKCIHTIPTITSGLNISTFTITLITVVGIYWSKYQYTAPDFLYIKFTQPRLNFVWCCYQKRRAVIDTSIRWNKLLFPCMVFIEKIFCLVWDILVIVIYIKIIIRH